ncbi:MAG: hypothetical protein KGH96_22025 [Sphingomonadales bacterium]|nr:hypothetical protein [Sphingomonadales bacterium]
MALLDQLFMDYPWYRTRQMAGHLQRLGDAVRRRQLRRFYRAREKAFH